MVVYLQELKSRAEIISKKEDILKEKGKLELKHLRASQQLARVSGLLCNFVIGQFPLNKYNGWHLHPIDLPGQFSGQ